jgi:hypothetical protein
VEFTFPITQRDHYRASRAIQRRQPSVWIAYAFFIGIPIVILVLAIFFGETVQEVLRENWGALIGGPAFVLIGFPLLLRWNVHSAHKSNPSLRGNQTFALTSNGLSARGPLHSITVAWDGITRVLETSEYFLFFVSRNTAYFIPTREIGRVLSIEEFRARLLEWVPNRTKLRQETRLSGAAA